MRIEEAEERMRQAHQRASGYIDLWRIANENGGDGEKMRLAALAELMRVSDDDDLIDALYDADMREQRQLERMGFYDDNQA